MKMPKSQPVTPTPPAPMPDPNSPEVMEARKKKTAEMMNRAGRSSTILSGGNAEGAAGTDYTAKTLG